MAIAILAALKNSDWLIDWLIDWHSHSAGLVHTVIKLHYVCYSVSVSFLSLHCIQKNVSTYTCVFQPGFRAA